MAYNVIYRDSIIQVKDDYIDIQEAEIAYSDSLFLDCSTKNEKLITDNNALSVKVKRNRRIAIAEGVGILGALVLVIAIK